MMAAHPIMTDLRRIRQAGRISQDAVAAAIGNGSHAIISRLELGTHDGLLSTVSKFADALGYELVLRRKEP